MRTTMQRVASLFLGVFLVFAVHIGSAGADEIPNFEEQSMQSSQAFEALKEKSLLRSRQRTQLPDFSYNKPVESNELSRYFGYQSDGFMSGVEWALDTSKSEVSVISPLAGTVVGLSDSSVLGKTIKIHHVQGIETYLAHLENVNLKEGDIVSPGQEIGTVDTHKFQTLYHEIRIENVAVDPAEAIGIDLLNMKDVLFEDAKKALQKEARVEKVVIEAPEAQMSYAAPATPTTYAQQVGAEEEQFCNPDDAPPTCDPDTYMAICEARNQQVNGVRQRAQEDLGQPQQSVLDALCVEQLLNQVLNLGNTYQGTNPQASQIQMQRALREIKLLKNAFVGGNYLAGAGILVAVRDAAQAALDGMVNAINNFIVGTITDIANALTGGLFGAIFGLGSQYNCQGIAAIWYTAENCFGLDIGGFLDDITLGRIELPEFGCVIESLASSYNPGFYSGFGDDDYVPYGQVRQRTRCNRWEQWEGGCEESSRGGR